MGQKIINLTTEDLRDEARDKPIEAVTFRDFTADQTEQADEVYFRHQGRVLCIKYRGMNRAERSNV